MTHNASTLDHGGAMQTVSLKAVKKQSWEKGVWEHSPAMASVFVLSSEPEHRRDFSSDLILGYLQVMLYGGFTCAVTKFRLSF